MSEAESLGVNAASTAVPAGGKRLITRSRQGCLVCRGRRIKCDLEKPECARCTKYGAICEWPVKARARTRHLAQLAPVTGLEVQQGSGHQQPAVETPPVPEVTSSVQVAPANPDTPAIFTHHRLSPVTSPRITKHGPAFGTPASLAALDDIDRILALCKDTRMSNFFGTPTPPPDYLRAIFPIEEDLRCFHHCITFSLYIIVISENENPWIDHVIRLLLFNNQDPSGSDALKHAMLYAGAVHLSYLQGRDGDSASGSKTREAALRYRSTGAQLLRRMLEGTPALGPAYFAAVALMLTADLLAAQPRWRPIMRLARRGIRREGGCATLLFRGNTVDPAMKCAIDSLAFLAVVGSLGSGEYWHILGASDLGDPEETWWDKLTEAEHRQHELPKFQALTGVSRPVLKLFASVVAAVPTRDIPATMTLDTAAGLRLALDTWTATQHVDSMSERTRAGSLAFWHTANILLLTSSGGSYFERTVTTSAATIMEQCVLVGDKIEYLNWPIIVACRTMTVQVNREAARERLRSFVTQCCYEIEVVQALCEEMWARIDQGDDAESCGWSEVLVDLGCSVMLG